LEATVLAKRTIVINFGKIIFDDATSELKRNYLKTKIVELVTEEPIGKFSFAGGKILEQGKFNIKIELDVAAASIEKLVNYALGHYSIKDINIFDPSMEEIIADIYRSQAGQKS